MESVPQLCDLCSQTSFEALASPTALDIFRARKALRDNRPVPQFLPFRESQAQKKAFEPQRVTLGSLDEVQKSSASCHLCALVYNAITREGDLPVHDGDELIVSLNPDTSYHGYITDAKTDIEGNWRGCLFLLRRLSATIQLASDSDEQGPLAYFDHSHSLVGSVQKLPQKINLHWIRHWIKTCDVDHGDQCKLAEEQSQNFFVRLIRMLDVRRKCIRTFKDVNPTDIKFVALSYVWGGPQTLQLLKSNRRDWERGGSLGKAKLPQTLADAMDVTHDLGVDFIWIDTLCIVQDDPDDLREQIGSVALIYRSALLTIIAAHGSNCNDGLPGLRSGTRTFEQKEVVVIPPSAQHPGMSLINTCKSYRYPLVKFSRAEEDIDMSVWNTRGWTLQERVLSRRNLVFTKEQVMWICDGAIFCEESHFEHPNLESDSYIRKVDETALRFNLFKKSANAMSFQSLDGAVLVTSQERFWEKYKSLVKWFTGRSFTYPGDAFDGFRGITDALERLSSEKFLWGHPRSRFCLSLLWESDHNVVPHRRTELTTLPMTNLDTNVTFPSWSWLGWKAAVTCSVGDDRRESDTAEIVTFVHTSNPFRIHAIHATNRYDYLYSLENLKNDLERPSAVPWKPFDDAVVTIEDIQNELPRLTESRFQQLPDEHVIFFWASSAIFNVRSTSQQYFRQTLDVVNTAGDCIGTAHRTETPQWKLSSADRPTRCEFVAVSRRYTPALPEFPPMVIALQIIWEDSIAYRVSIAEIQEAAWMDASPQWKLIALM